MPKEISKQIDIIMTDTSGCRTKRKLSLPFMQKDRIIEHYCSINVSNMCIKIVRDLINKSDSRKKNAYC